MLLRTTSPAGPTPRDHHDESSTNMTDQLIHEKPEATAVRPDSAGPRNHHPAITATEAVRRTASGARVAAGRVARTATIAVRTHPLTAVLAAVFLLAEAGAALARGPISSVLAWVGTGPGPLVQEGHWWSPVTSLFFADGMPQFAVALIAVIVLVGASEKMMGARRAAVAFIATGVAGTLLGVGLQLAGEQAGELWAGAVHGIIASSPFAAACGAIAAASAFAGPLWRRRIRLLTVLAALVFVLYSGHPSDVYRLAAVVCGIVLGALMARTPSAHRSGWARSSHRETRVLMASAVSIMAIGPVVALLSHARFGPLSPISILFTSGLPTAHAADGSAQACRFPAVSDHCVQAFALDPMRGVGAVLMSVAPLIVLLIASYALVYGSRFALWTAVAVNVILSVSAAVSFGLFQAVGASRHIPFLAAHHSEILAGLVVAALLPLALAVVLVALRRRFPVKASMDSVRGFVVTVAAAAAGLAIAFLLGTLLTGGAAFLGSLSAPELVADVAQRFVPVHFWGLDHPGSHPATLAGGLVYHGVGPLFWLIVTVAALRPMFGSSTSPRATGADRARELVMRGGGALGFMATWRGNHYWFDADGVSGVAYRVVNGIAITTGGPIGTPSSEEATMRRFARFCDDNGWIPVFYSVDGELSGALLSMGWQTMVVAEEAVISPQQWSTTGKKWQDVRSSLNRADRAGIRSEWTSFAALSDSKQAQIAEISEEWIADKDLPEMGFTLGALDELRDPAVRLMLAVDANERVEAVTSWLPMYRDGIVVGWTLDVMRRRGDSINGVMEFLIAAAAVRMKEDGIETMSLSGAPLASANGAATANGPLDSVLDYLSASLEPVYGFQSLLRFKRKFQPEFRPLLMAYPDPVALPRIGVALTRAYLPGLSVTQAAALLRSRH